MNLEDMPSTVTDKAICQSLSGLSSLH
jgi:hypothetical protein